MSDFGDELRDCLGEILGTVPPRAEDDPLLFFKQWLAERNLGLVPIDNAASFAWPGRWLACIRATDRDHAVVMFGAPSGPIFDPAGALASGGTIHAGWLLAPLDLELPKDNPYGIDPGAGSVAGLRLAAGAEEPYPDPLRWRRSLASARRASWLRWPTRESSASLWIATARTSRGSPRPRRQRRHRWRSTLPRVPTSARSS
jgi:hypothetical protein